MHAPFQHSASARRHVVHHHHHTNHHTGHDKNVQRRSPLQVPRRPTLPLRLALRLGKRPKRKVHPSQRAHVQSAKVLDCAVVHVVDVGVLISPTTAANSCTVARPTYRRRNDSSPLGEAWNAIASGCETQCAEWAGSAYESAVGE
jgi:hypothetical protein